MGPLPFLFWLVGLFIYFSSNAQKASKTFVDEVFEDLWSFLKPDSSLTGSNLAFYNTGSD